MTDALLSSGPLVAEFDAHAGLYLAREWVAGPAGVATLRLGGNVEGGFDVAWPSRVAEVGIPTTGGQPHGQTAAVVGRMFGSARMARLLAIDGNAPRRLDDEDGAPDAMLTLPLGALAQQIGDDTDTSLLRRGAALLEASLWLQRDADELGVRPASADDFRRGA